MKTSSLIALPSALVLCAGLALARQDGAPPKDPPAEAPKAAESKPADPKPADIKYDASGRKIADGPDTVLAFKNVTVDQIVPFIVEATGKVVMPQQDILTRKITVLNDRPIPRQKALDLVFLALREGGIAVFETKDTVALRDVGEIIKANAPVIGPDESILDRTDYGNFACKVFSLKHSQADGYTDVLKNIAPEYAKISVDKDSNRISVIGDIALLQRLERTIALLDQPAEGAVQSETFRLTYADAEQIATQINDLFSASSTTGRNRNRNNQNQQNQGFRFPGQQQPESAASSAQLKVSANTQQNAVTVVAEPNVLEQVKDLIRNYWDLALPPDLVVPKVYDLKNTDPVKVRAVLEGIFGKASNTAGTGGGQGGGQGGGGNQGGQGQPVGTTSTTGVGRLAGQFSFQAMPEAGRLIVITKSPANIKVIDEIIEKLDQPQNVGVPVIIELKHASAEDLAEQLNTLLAQDGTLAQIRRAAAGLESGTVATSPFATSSSSTNTTNTNGQDTATTSANSISFWWQRSRPPTDKQNPSNLVGQIRIVPVWRQNALMVLSPVEYKNAVAQLIADLDKPGRQVLISAIIAEVSLEDATSLGLRWSSQTLNPSGSGDNSISVTNTSTNTKNDFLGGLFDTSVLNTNINLNLVLQALAQKTAVTVLSEPKIFTSDNQEADFFSGQDIPFITQSQPNTQGNLVQSFDYKAVGIQMRVRPRITIRRDVDLAVNLQLSSVVQGQTLFGGAIVDRRETTTQLIVQDGQTVVISGILRSEDSDIVRKVPLLGDIPLLGWIFRSKEKTKSNSEVLVFITPIVVDNPSDNDRLNQPFIDRLKEREDSINKNNPKDKDKKGDQPSLPGSINPAPRPVGSSS